MRTPTLLTALALLAATSMPSWANLWQHPPGAAPRAAASATKPNCETALGNQSFDCHVKSSLGDDFTDCFQFFSPGTTSLHFDLVVLGFDPFEHLGCACTATGSLKKPKFDAGKSFVCNSEFGFSFAGKVGGKGSKTKIGKGFASNGFGDSFVFECTLSPTACGASPSGAFIDGPMAY